MSQMVTKCPQCETTFRVTDAQLQVAKGKVRCGSCLHVFKADEHWLNPPAPAPAPSAPPPQKPATEEASAGKFVFDQSAIDGASAEKVLTKPSITAVNTQGEMKALQEFAESLSDDDDEELFDDGDDALVSDTETEMVAADDSDYSDLFLDLDDLEEQGLDNFEQIEDQSVADGGSSDESWAKDLLDDLEDDSEERAEHEKSLLSGELEQDNTFADDAPEKEESARDAFISDTSSFDDESDARRDLGLDKPAGMGSGSLLSKIEPAPVEMEWQPSAKGWLSTLMWGGLSVLMLLLLVVQYGWLKFDDLAREKGYRPMYASVCGVIGCDLPDLYNAAAIRSQNLVVRSHPTMENVLVVDTILQNIASYEQPFPDIELYFSSLDNFPVASRRFTAAEYLAGEMAGKKMMPSAKSIHISLQIVDPGEEAVNYRLEVSSEKPAQASL